MKQFPRNLLPYFNSNSLFSAFLRFIIFSFLFWGCYFYTAQLHLPCPSRCRLSGLFFSMLQSGSAADILPLWHHKFECKCVRCWYAISYGPSFNGTNFMVVMHCCIEDSDRERESSIISRS